MPYRTNAFINHENSSEVIHFHFSKLKLPKSIFSYLTDKNGGIVDPSWFGSSRKKDIVIVASLLGIVGRAFRRKNLREDETSRSDIGKVLGYGLLYGPDESHEKFVKNVLSTALCTVAEKKGIKRTFDPSLSDNLTTNYVQSLRVPDWIQLYVKLAMKLPNRSWQTLLNFFKHRPQRQVR